MDHYFDSHSVLLLRERLERKRLRQWLRLQQRLRRLLLTEVPKQIESMHGRRGPERGARPFLSACQPDSWKPLSGVPCNLRREELPFYENGCMINTNEPFRLEQGRQPMPGEGAGCACLRLLWKPSAVRPCVRTGVPAFCSGSEGGRRALLRRAGPMQAEKLPLERQS